MHKVLGPGLLESTYEQCLARELEIGGLAFARQSPLPVTYKGLDLGCGYRVDLLVELKAVEQVLPVHHAQVLSYLKLSGMRIGLLINFNVQLLKDGVRRFVL